MEMVMKNSMRYVVAFGLAAFAVLTVVLAGFVQMNTTTFGYMGMALIIIDIVVSMGITMILNHVATE